jgi:hypothetical protein
VRRLALVALIFAAVPSSVDGEDPDAAKGPLVTTASVPGTPIKLVRATAEVDAIPEVVLAIIDDVEHYEATMPYVVESRVLDRTPTSLLNYQRLHFPVALVDDRDYVIRITASAATLPSGGVVHQRSWRLADSNRVPEVTGVVRVPLNEGRWTVRAADRGSRVTYCVFTDPGGGIWKWVANQANLQAIPRLFQSLREAAKLLRYTTSSRGRRLEPDATAPLDRGACGTD